MAVIRAIAVGWAEVAQRPKAHQSLRGRSQKLVGLRSLHDLGPPYGSAHPTDRPTLRQNPDVSVGDGAELYGARVATQVVPAHAPGHTIPGCQFAQGIGDARSIQTGLLDCRYEQLHRIVRGTGGEVGSCFKTIAEGLLEFLPRRTEFDQQRKDDAVRRRTRLLNEWLSAAGRTGQQVTRIAVRVQLPHDLG